MSIYAISDLHLSFGVDKPMNVFGKIWDGYEDKIKEDWEEKVNNDDIVIIPGDISWGMTLNEALEDFRFIGNLPGKKIILRGNHDYYFNTKTKVEKFFEENGLNSIQVLHNNAYDLGNVILCGTRGWDKTENTSKEEDKKIIMREEGRLKLSLEYGKKINVENKDILVAMHFPPFCGNFKKIMEEYNVKMCIYGHLHGYGHMLVKEGIISNIEYKMVACDYTGFKLIKLY